MRSRATQAGHSARRGLRFLILALLAVAATARPALAGPPLLCHPFDIGSATSLPWSGASSWFDGQPGYDLQRLVQDTEALLTPATPVVVRMETLRRAAIYAGRDPLVAKRLFLTINDRVRTASAGAKQTDALAVFDAGYLAATFREIGRLGPGTYQRAALDGPAVEALVNGADGYALVQKSLVLRPGDPAIEFAAAIIARSTPDRRADFGAHAQKARAGAPQDALLLKNVQHIAE